MDARMLGRDRKSTRLNSSHSQISYAVFCLKKKRSWRVAAARGAIEQLVEVTPRHQRGDQRNTQRLHGLRTRGCKRRTASARVPRGRWGRSARASAATCGVEATGVSRALRFGGPPCILQWQQRLAPSSCGSALRVAVYPSRMRTPLISCAAVLTLGCGEPAGPHSTSHTLSITASETWTLAESPHVVHGRLSVRGTLTIEAGATVLFADKIGRAHV